MVDIYKSHGRKFKTKNHLKRTKVDGTILPQWTWTGKGDSFWKPWFWELVKFPGCNLMNWNVAPKKRKKNKGNKNHPSLENFPWTKTQLHQNPYAPCMEYLPTFGVNLWQHVGVFLETTHGAKPRNPRHKRLSRKNRPLARCKAASWFQQAHAWMSQEVSINA